MSRTGVSLEARRFAVDLGNTVACPMCRGSDALASVGEAQRWIRRKLPSEAIRVRPGDLVELCRFRGQLRQLLEAASDRTPPPAAAIASLNRALAKPAFRAELQWVRGSFELEEHVRVLSAPQRVKALAAQSFVQLLGEAPPTRIRRCEGPGCVHFLIVRRPEQRWCSPTGCGNRVRVQRHYRKLRSLRDSKRTRSGRHAGARREAAEHLRVGSAARGQIPSGAAGKG